ncbi:MAG: DUF4240 domain-containing protein [Chloroflexota bacterium]
MDTEKFWSMIDEARQKGLGDARKQRELLIDALCDLSPEHIQQFDRLLSTMMSRAYRADLWEAAWLVACGCGDDSFHDFRYWLIGQGQTIYEKVLEEPENLVDLVDGNQRLSIFDSWAANVAASAYERKTNQPLPEIGDVAKSVLIGSLVSEDEIPAKFPRIVAKLGDCTEVDFL